jgi:hypothetical protein
MTSLTTMTATSSLMHTATDAHPAPSQTTPPQPPPHLARSRVNPWAAIAAFVISASLLGGTVIGLTMPPSVSAAIADAESV